MNDQEYQDEIQQLLDEQEASFEKPGWKRHFKTIGQIALVIGLLYLLVYVWHRYHDPSPVVPEVVEGAEGDGVLSDVFGEHSPLEDGRKDALRIFPKALGRALYSHRVTQKLNNTPTVPGYCAPPTGELSEGLRGPTPNQAKIQSPFKNQNQ